MEDPLVNLTRAVIVQIRGVNLLVQRILEVYADAVLSVFLVLFVLSQRRGSQD